MEVQVKTLMDVLDYLEQGMPVMAVKTVRDDLGCRLKDAKGFVDMFSKYNKDLVCLDEEARITIMEA